jgi:hypothetical protein
MTEMTSDPPVLPSRQQDGAGTPGPVLVAAAGPVVQRRATVAIRLFLAVPHLLALYFLGVAAAAVAVIGWAGALVSGRLPRFAAAYLSGYLRWSGRAGGYLLLLTDEYPPFAFDDAAYPVRLAAGAGRLNRLTVAFRVILAIPAAIVSLLLTCGLALVVIFIGWLAVLITGRLPVSLHQAFAAVLRYTVRYYGYLYLLTGAYPAGLFGDDPGRPGWEAGLFDGDTDWRLPLSSRAKRVVGLMIVLGLLSAAGAGAWAGVAISAARERAREISLLDTAVARHNAAVARHNAAVITEQGAAAQVTRASAALSSAHDTLYGVLNGPSSDSSDCASVDCFNVTSEPGAEAFAAFGRTLRATPVPPGSAAIAKRLSAATASTGKDWVAMARDTSFGSFGNDATAAEKDGGHFDSDYQALMTSLDNAQVTLGSQAAALDNAATPLNREAAALRRQAAALNVTIGVRAASLA